MRVDEAAGRWWECLSCRGRFKLTIWVPPIGNIQNVQCPFGTQPLCLHSRNTCIPFTGESNNSNDVMG